MSNILSLVIHNVPCFLRTPSRALPLRRYGGPEARALGVQVRRRDQPVPTAAAAQAGLGHLHSQEPGEHRGAHGATANTLPSFCFMFVSMTVKRVGS